MQISTKYLVDMFDFNILDEYVSETGNSESFNYGEDNYFDSVEHSSHSSFGSHVGYDEGISGMSMMEYNSMMDFTLSYGHNYEPSFGGELVPYNDSLTGNYVYQVRDPIGRYATENICGFARGNITLESFPEVHLLDNFTSAELQQVCNTIGDVLHWSHLPVDITQSVNNAAFFPGLFNRLTFDDSLCLNPDYAQECIKELGSTDIVISDMGHEYGHSMAAKLCGGMSRFYQEKVADFVSGFVNGKLNVEIDTARRWFEWQYDETGDKNYPNSSERWDAEAAGYYFSHLANGDDLIAALKDQNFIRIIEAYQHDTLDMVNEMAFGSTSSDVSFIEGIKEFGAKFIKNVYDLDKKYHFLPIAMRTLKAIRI